MKLTYDLKIQYTNQANAVFKELTGLECSAFFAGAKVTTPIESFIVYWNNNAAEGEHINIQVNYCLSDRLVLYKMENWPDFWEGSIHIEKETVWFKKAFVTEKLWNILYEIAKNPEKISPIKEWNDLCKIAAQKHKKSVASKEKIERAKLDFDGVLNQKQIKTQYPNYKVTFLKTKIKFYKILAFTFNHQPVYMEKSDWTINICPVNKSIDDFYNNRLLYNKTLFENLMSKWSNYNAFDEEV